MRSSKGTIHCRPFQPCHHHGHVFRPATIESVDGSSTAHGRDAALLGFLVNDADPHAPKPRGPGLVVTRLKIKGTILGCEYHRYSHPKFGVIWADLSIDPSWSIRALMFSDLSHEASSCSISGSGNMRVSQSISTKSTTLNNTENLPFIDHAVKPWIYHIYVRLP